MLKTEKLTKKFGGLIALRDLDLEIDDSSITGLIGPNGSGKSTLINIITGFDFATSGKVRYKERELGKMSPHDRVKLGISRTFQQPRPFRDLTALENVMIACLRTEKDIEVARKSALQALSLVQLEKFKDYKMSELNTSTARLIAVAAALSTRARFILIDEGAAGLNTAERELFVESLRLVHERGIGLLVVEHVLKIISNLCSSVIVLDHGEKIAQASPQEVMKSSEVIRVFLGVSGNIPT